jgi:hypothetical protein
MVIRPDLSTAKSRQQLVAQLATAIQNNDRVGSDLLLDEQGLVAAIFTAKPDNRVHYVERVDRDEPNGIRALVLRPNRTKRLTRNPVKLAQGDPYETTASPQAFVHALPTEPLVQYADLVRIQRWLLNNLRVGNSRTLLKRQQARSDRQLEQLYHRFFRC